MIQWNGRPKRTRKPPPKTYFDEFVATDPWYVRELTNDVPADEWTAAVEDETWDKEGDGESDDSLEESGEEEDGEEETDSDYSDADSEDDDDDDADDLDAEGSGDDRDADELSLSDSTSVSGSSSPRSVITAPTGRGN